MKAFWRSAVFLVKGHTATLKLLFEEPPPAIHWHRIEGLLTACGVKVCSGPGDGTFLEINGVRAEVHTPEDEAPRPVVRKTRDFLQKSGITPSDIRHFLGAMP
jgi:hypothetical protein